MRALIRTLLARYPFLAAGLVFVRWLLWLAVGHPVAVATTVTGTIAGAPLRIVIPVALTLDLTLLLIADQADGTRPAEALTLWARAARFRRRWPTAMAGSAAAGQRDVSIVFAHNYYSVPDGFRPILDCPRLSLLPRPRNGHTITWTIRPWPGQTLAGLDRHLQAVTDGDRRIDRVHIEAAGSRRPTLVVTFEHDIPLGAVQPHGGGEPHRVQPTDPVHPADPSLDLHQDPTVTGHPLDPPEVDPGPGEPGWPQAS